MQIPDVVVYGKGALLAPERDVEALAKHLKYLVEHPDVVGCYGKGWTGACGAGI